MLVRASQMRVAPHALMFDPEFYLFDFSETHRITKFLLVDERSLRLAPFVDIRFEPMARGSFLMDTPELVALEHQHGQPRPPPGFIFHHAFVCSTLLARCLDRIDAFFCLKEPWIMRRLADSKRAPAPGMTRDEWRRMFVTCMRVLSKPYASGRSPLVKATNVANNLLPEVLEYLPGSRSLYLYSDLQSFLVSNLKKPEPTQRKMPGLARAFIRDEGFATRFPDYCALERLSFLQVCALTWTACLYNFKRAVEDCTAPVVRTLHTEDFLGNPQNSLHALTAFFGHDSTAAEIAAMTSTDVMETDAKQQRRRYGRIERTREARAILERHRTAVRDVLEWIRPLVDRLELLDFMRSLQLPSRAAVGVPRIVAEHDRGLEFRDAVKEARPDPLSRAQPGWERR